MLKFFAVTLILLAYEVSFSQLTYTVDLNSTQTHKVTVTVDVKSLSSKKITYQMPIWAPGAYSVTHYGHYITDFKAFDVSGNEIPVKQIDGDRWDATGKMIIQKLSYSVSDSHKDSTSLYFALAHIDTNFFFANGTCLFGYVNDKKDLVAGVSYHFPKNWLLSTSLEPWDKEKIKLVSGYPQFPTFRLKEFKARNYDELADAPVMADTGLQTRTFKEGKAWYDIVLASNKPFDMDSLAECTRKIVRAQTDFFHDTPFEHYTFLINAPTFDRSVGAGQGALEHSNSSAYLLANIPWPYFKQYGPEILSHEFFHLWNVKRIHSSLLGPFDYTKRVMTTSLWLSEGITDYYAHVLLTRAGIVPYKEFESMLTGLAGPVERSSTAKSETLEQLSIDESDFDLDKAIIFYTKGTLVGLLLDIEIRSRTNNTKSLDDVMLALNADAKKGKTFQDNELIGKMEKIVGIDLQDFYKKYIAGTDKLPLTEYLKKMGIGKPAGGQVDTVLHFGARIHPVENGKMIISKVTSESPIGLAGAMENDTVITINGFPCTPEKLNYVRTKSKLPATVEMDVMRASGPRHLTLQFAKPKEAKDYSPLPDATPLEIAIRHGIVGSGY
ncbi:MAG: hypothetical protein WCH46_06365 [bacterium]